MKKQKLKVVIIKNSTGCPRRGCSIKYSKLPQMKKAA